MDLERSDADASVRYAAAVRVSGAVLYRELNGESKADGTIGFRAARLVTQRVLANLIGKGIMDAGIAVSWEYPPHLDCVVLSTWSHDKRVVDAFKEVVMPMAMEGRL